MRYKQAPTAQFHKIKKFTSRVCSTYPESQRLSICVDLTSLIFGMKAIKTQKRKKKTRFLPKFQSKSKLNSWGFSSFPNLAFQKANFFNQRSKISPNFPKKKPT